MLAEELQHSSRFNRSARWC